MPSFAHLFAVLCLVSHISPAALAFSFDFPAVFNFGDSNSDTGDLVAAGIDALLPPYGQSYFSRPAGRFSDGRLIIDFLMVAFDKPFLNAYLNSVGAPNFHYGCNFAAASSTILPKTKFSMSPFPFPIQVAQFFQFKSEVLQLLTKDDEPLKYIPQADYFNRGLYTFDIGQNDLQFALFTKTADQAIASIPKMLLEFEEGLQKLYDQGARRFWIHNTGPLGCLAQNIAIFGKDPSKLDELGCLSSYNRVAKHFNAQLHALCIKLRGLLSDANITYVDVFTIKFNLIANFSQYGFEHPLTACCGYGGPPLNYDTRLACGETKVIDGHTLKTKACNDVTEYINWDGVHYTEAANLHVAFQIITGKYSYPPFSEDMPFALKRKL